MNQQILNTMRATAARASSPTCKVYCNFLSEVLAERDELLAALIAFRDGGPRGANDFAGWHDSYASAIEKARTVIARSAT